MKPKSICPLFIPLRREFFEAFKSGAKDTKYRRRGPRWNMDTCWIGRRVVLALGYTKTRLYGKVVGCHYANLPAALPGWLECYGPNAGTATCIKIQLDEVKR